ncbi:2-ketogluconate reductase [Cupriavidus basilensis OR16]|uniref:2-ketogluconate reductase n=1 Tax=Cupriavidus basilensis OR16 TaxID=1127483 RepID=H1SC06_9BURK|nr:2-ketogluconate reductase [Cupriavidus basilensis OR16]
MYRNVPQSVLALLREQHDVIEVEQVAAASRAPLIEALARAHGILGNNMKITPELLDAAPFLEAASTISAGFDAFDVEDLTRRGIVLNNTPDELTETTADLAFTLLLASARRVVELAEWMRRGEWRASVGAERLSSASTFITRRSASSGSDASAVHSRDARRWVSEWTCCIAIAHATTKRKKPTVRNGAHCRNCSRRPISCACWCRCLPRPSG